MRAAIILLVALLSLLGAACGDDGGSTGAALEPDPQPEPTPEPEACADPEACAQGTCEPGEGGDFSCVCDEGWDGARCEVCAEGFVGPSCEPCRCVMGACDGQGVCVCDEGFAGGECALLDHGAPPATMRLRVDKQGEPRTLVFERYNVRAGGQMEVKVVPVQGANRDHDLEAAIRTYRGYCEEEPDAIVSGLVLPSGGFRYSVFKGNPHEDWGFVPQEELEPGAEVEIPYEVIQGPALPRAGAAMEGASFTAQNPNGGRFYDEVFRAHVALIVNKAYIDAFGFDAETIVRKAESTIARSNHATLRDALIETVISGVLIREDRDVDFEQGYGEFTSRFAGIFPNTVMTLTNEGSSGLTYVCITGGESADPNTNTYATGKSGPSPDGTWYGVFRHEYGHSLGSSHFEGGAPEGRTIMSGNSLSRFSGYEVQAMVDCRQTGGGDASRFNEALGHYRDYPIPPYARVDDRIAHDPGEGELPIDVLGNDHDVNGDEIALSEIEATSALGGTVALRAGEGPEGRDILAYLAPESFSADISVDQCAPGEALEADDCATCVPVIAEGACEEAGDCPQGSVCVAGQCRLTPGCEGQSLTGACGHPCPHPSMRLWLDASDLASMATAEGNRGAQLVQGDEIVAWGDRSGLGNDARVFHEGKAPALHLEGEQAIAQRPSLRFEGGFMEVRGLDVRPEALGALTTFSVVRGGSGVVIWVQRQNGFDKRQHTAFGTTGDVPSLTTASIEGQTERHWANRVEQEGSPSERALMPGGPGIGIGALLYAFEGYEGAYDQDFTLAELLVFEGALSDEDRAAIESYLVARWRIAMRDRFWYSIVDTSGLVGKAPVFIDLQ